MRIIKPSFKTSLKIRKHFNKIKPSMDKVDELVMGQARAFDPGIEGYVDYATSVSGKRIRAGLAILSAEASGGMDEPHLDLAVIIELIHLASLIHDDIMDNALIRRSKPTVYAKWGAELSVLLGDALFAHAMKLCLDFESRKVSHAVADAANQVCTGEILQTQRRFDFKMTVEDYLRIIDMKTAALFRVSCEQAAALNKLPTEEIEKFSKYGKSLGIAYQIYDDCLDFFGEEDDSGKTLGTDLEKGKLTYPLLHALKKMDAGEYQQATEIILHGDAEDKKGIIAKITELGSLNSAVQTTVDYCEEAIAQIQDIPPSTYKDTLMAMAEQLRDHIRSLEES